MVSGSVIIALLLQDLEEGRSLADQRFEWQESSPDRSEGTYGTYPVTLESGKKYIFIARGGHGGNSADPFLLLFRPDGGLGAYDDDGAGGLDSRLAYAPPTPGRYLLKLRARARGRFGFCTLSMSSMPAPRPPEGDRRVRVGETLRQQRFAWLAGDRHEGDYAQYSMELQVGSRVAIEISDIREGTTGDAVLYVLSDSTVLAVDDDSGPELQPRLLFEAPADGIYVIRLRAFSRGAYGTCTLALKPAPYSR